MTLESRRPQEMEDDGALQESSPAYQEKPRRCLSCSETFDSAWAGERICKKCRSSSKWRQGYD